MKINLTLVVIVLTLLTACAKNVNGEDTASRTDNEIITNVEMAVASDSALIRYLGDLIFVRHKNNVAQLTKKR